MITESSITTVKLFLLFLLILLIPLWYALYTYSPSVVKPLTRWRFAFISLLVTYGISAFIGILIFPIEAVANEVGGLFEDRGWFIASDIAEGFGDVSLPFWLAATIVIGLSMPSKVEEFVANIRNHDAES